MSTMLEIKLGLTNLMSIVSMFMSDSLRHVTIMVVIVIYDLTTTNYMVDHLITINLIYNEG